MRLRPIRSRPLFAAALALALAGCASAPAPEATPPIGALQGRGDASPRVGESATVNGVVVAIFPELGGAFVQDGGDGDPATSDALFLHGAAGVAPGQRVRARGRVVELETGGGASLTALDAVTVEVLGAGALPAPVAVAAPPAAWEALEGMRVRIDAPLTIAGLHNLERFGELTASFGGRPFTPTEVAAPGPEAARVAADNLRRRLLLDDGRDARDAGLPAYLAAAPRSGSTVAGAAGIVDQRHGAWRLQLTEPLAVDPAPRPPAPTVAGDVRIAGLNLENLFNGDGRGGGFPTARGARTPAEWAAQRDKLVATLRALDPDIAVLMELENDGAGPDSSLAQFAAALGSDWRFVDPGHGPGNDQIRVALLYRAGRVRPAGAAASLADGPFATHSRAPLAQTFVPVAAGRDAGPAFTVAANHFKSKGCGNAAGADADQGDGQACWNATRTGSARRLAAWLATDPTHSGSDLALIVGDLNAYAQEDPIRLLRAAGWRDAFAGSTASDGPAPYSYVYDGQSGRLDHALLSPALAARLGGAAEWHSNADEPAASGYRAGGPGPWGSSDHDPLLLGLWLRDVPADLHRRDALHDGGLHEGMNRDSGMIGR